MPDGEAAQRPAALTVRLARDADGSAIAGLARRGGFEIDGLDWSDIEPYWLVAGDRERIIGALQIILGKPIGWLEILVVDKELDHRMTAIAVKALVERGMTLLAGFGASAVMGSVPDDLRDYMDVIERRGGVTQSHGTLFSKRLR